MLIVLVLSFAAVRADDLSDVKQAGVLRLGIAPEYIPFVFYDDSGTLTGIDVALIDEVGRRLGVRVQPVDLAFSSLMDSLEIGQVDVIGGAFSKTDERAQRIDYSRVYYNGMAQFIGLASLPKPQSITYDSFRDMKIGVQRGTSFDQWIKSNLVAGGYVSTRNVYTYSNAADEMKALDRRDVDLVLMDQDLYEDLYRPTGKYMIFYDGFVKENYAFGLRKNSNLTSVINDLLTEMIKDGTAQSIADRFFRMNYQEADVTISRGSQVPTPVPSVPVVVMPTVVPQTNCVNSMSFVSDVTITDGHQVTAGERFRKTWRVYNNGSCTWTPSYSFVFVSGDQMSGKNINVPTTVKPGQTVDLSVDLKAPNSDGTYRGYWQMRSPQGTNFGQSIWVKIRVKGTAPKPTPKPGEDGQRYVPITINSFYPDYYSGNQGNCTKVYWSTKGSSMVEITVDGSSMYRGTSQNGSQQICGPITSVGTHTVQLYAFNVTTDAYSSFTYTTKGSGDDGQKRVIPQVNYFYIDPSSGYMGDSATVYWSVSNASAVDIYVDGTQIERSTNANGSAPVSATIQSEGIHNITLIAHTVTDDATATAQYRMMERSTSDGGDRGGYAGMNYYENENGSDEGDRGGYAGMNYYENENGSDEGDRGGYAGMNYYENENTPDEGGYAGMNYFENENTPDEGGYAGMNYYENESVYDDGGYAGSNYYENETVYDSGGGDSYDSGSAYDSGGDSYDSGGSVSEDYYDPETDSWG